MVGFKASWKKQVCPCPVPTLAWLNDSALKGCLPLAIPKSPTDAGRSMSSSNMMTGSRLTLGLVVQGPAYPQARTPLTNQSRALSPPLPSTDTNCISWLKKPMTG